MAVHGAVLIVCYRLWHGTDGLQIHNIWFATPRLESPGAITKNSRESMSQAEEGRLREIHGSASKKPPAAAIAAVAAAMSATSCGTSSPVLAALLAPARFQPIAVNPHGPGHHSGWITSAGISSEDIHPLAWHPGPRAQFSGRRGRGELERNSATSGASFSRASVSELRHCFSISTMSFDGRTISRKRQVGWSKTDQQRAVLFRSKNSLSTKGK